MRERRERLLNVRKGKLYGIDEEEGKNKKGKYKWDVYGKEARVGKKKKGKKINARKWKI